MDIQTLKAEVPITDILDYYGWTGESRWSSGDWIPTRCPFHDDNNPSASYNPIEDKFHCFTCGVGGDIIDIVQDQEGLDVKEAMTWIEEMFLT